MKVQNIPKISPKIELTSPELLHCKSGECGGCPNGTGKLLWIPKNLIGALGTTSLSFNFQYNFFNKSTESEGSIKYNRFDYSVFYNSQQQGSYSRPPDRNWAVVNNIYMIDPYLSPSLMRGSDIIRDIALVVDQGGEGGWIFFRQPNPAIGNVHDALCFEYNHEKRLITFRSF
jgi:hypothetical protein